MKYYESDSKFSKRLGSFGFYAIIACCLIAIGATSYFAISKFRSVNKEDAPKNNSSVYESNRNSYNSKDDIITEPDAKTQDVAKPEVSVPYTPKEETEPKKEVISFMMPVENGTVIKGYSHDTLQYSSTYEDLRLHLGLDISCNKSSYVKACAKGTVKTISENADIGRYVEVDHTNGIVIRYCGLESINVAVGEAVNGGDVLGTAGTVTSECIDKPHIHVEVYENGKAINPARILGS